MKKKNAAHALVICNGEMPSSKHFAKLLKNKPFIVCADGGANKARTYGIVPDLIIGDLDSITKATRMTFTHVPTIQVSDQNSTDLEKALMHILSQGYTSALVIGATGDRPDHTMANFSILQKYHHALTLQLFDDFCTIEIVEKKIKFTAVPGQQISLLPMGLCQGISTSGLKYPLRNEALQLGVREGSSNEAVRTQVSISVRKGMLLLFKIHPTVTRA
jgi:thiamine pyrophosphokinase